MPGDPWFIALLPVIPYCRSDLRQSSVSAPLLLPFPLAASSAATVRRRRRVLFFSLLVLISRSSSEGASRSCITPSLWKVLVFFSLGDDAKDRGTLIWCEWSWDRGRDEIGFYGGFVSRQLRFRLMIQLFAIIWVQNLFLIILFKFSLISFMAHNMRETYVENNFDTLYVVP